ncbi:hypothetical protein OX284_007100 [Flavobacterium sp. SUN046]|uniref:hypothetical protein n=1 Tax=Flavobacterium sp. SUN046 TaxID=3002440 RepID=UPI002DBC4BF3|nr:hypothetical protein [Flavobacterium sp. SUN046]MEC4049191.1 hypothetical protein [Flavobacterium sp. SUN046]
MKKSIFFLFLILMSCSKSDPIIEDPLVKLSPETQTGANTFGCIINNQVFYPRDGTSTFLSPGGKGLIFWGDPSDPSGMGNYEEIEIRNLQDAKPANSMIIHLQGLDQIKTGEYIWHESNFQSSIDGLMQNYVYAKIYDASVNGWKYYGSYENSGKVTITRYDFTNRIVSGTFSGKLKLMNSTTEIEILNGRFDIKWSTLDTKSFP